MTETVFTNPATRSTELADAYVQAILDLVGDRDPLRILKDTPGTIREAVSGVQEKVLSTPEAPGKWSMAQVLWHLADSELVWGFRLRMVLAQERPPLTGYDQNAWVERLAQSRPNVQEVVREFSVLRAGNLRLLEGVSPVDLKRVGVHSERGEESLELMIPLYAGHDLVHLRQLDRIRTAVLG